MSSTPDPLDVLLGVPIYNAITRGVDRVIDMDWLYGEQRAIIATEVLETVKALLQPVLDHLEGHVRDKAAREIMQDVNVLFTERREAAMVEAAMRAAYIVRVGLPQNRRPRAPETDQDPGGR
jgi:hypothetical protein